MTCACGCGESVRAGLRFVWGHNLKTSQRGPIYTAAELLAHQRECSKRLRRERRERGQCAYCAADSVRFYACLACRRASSGRRRAA